MRKTFEKTDIMGTGDKNDNKWSKNYKPSDI